MIGEVPVIDAVVHSYNFDPSNYANEFAKPLAELVWGANYELSGRGYKIPKQGYLRDWSVEETASMVFLESDTDLAVYHVLPINAFADGCVSLEKACQVKERWPDRFVVYAGVDPLQGPAALEELQRQVEILDPIGLKLYPNSWATGNFGAWKMDDPEVAFPVFERARQLGIKVIAIHKAVPLGPVPIEHYKMDDIDRAAIAFPDLIFEVVHGGMAFVEESAWQIARFSNVYLNLEITTALAAVRPAAFQHVLQVLLSVGGETAIERILWGTGAMAFHPQPHLEAFWRFQFPPEVVEGYGVPQLTIEAKRKILAENYARMVGLDLAERLSRIRDDDFGRRRREGRAAPYSTTAVAGMVE